MNSCNIFTNIKPPIIIKKFQIFCFLLETSSLYLPHLSLNGFLNRPNLITIIIVPYIIPRVKTTNKIKMPIFISIVIVELVFSFFPIIIFHSALRSFLSFRLFLCFVQEVSCVVVFIIQ